MRSSGARRRRRISAVALRAAVASTLAVTGITLVAAPARAVTTNVGFEDGTVADGTTIRDQYLATYGVRFGTSAQLGFSLQGAALAAHDCDPVQDPIGVSHLLEPPGIPHDSAQGAVCTGPNEFRNPGGFAFFLASARPSLSMRIIARDVHLAGFTTDSVLVQAYRGDGTLLNEQHVAVASGTWATANVSTADAAGIQYVVVQSSTGIDNVDDISLPDPVVAPNAAWSLGLDSGDIYVPERSLGAIPVRVYRQNGSTGGITLSATPSDDGVPSTAFAPNPAGDSAGSSSMGFTTNGDPAGDYAGSVTTLTIAGTAPPSAGAAGPTVTLRVHILRALTLAVHPVSGAADCSDPSSLALTVNGYRGDVSLDSSIPDGIINDLPADIHVDHDGVYDIPFTFELYHGKTSENATFTAAADPSHSFSPATSTVSEALTVTPPTVVGSPIHPVTTPHEAGYFSSPTNVTYQIDDLPCRPLRMELGYPTPIGSFHGQAGRTTITLPVPDTAHVGTFTPAIVEGSPPYAKVLDLPPLTVRDFRQEDGLNFRNPVDTLVTWSDMERTFGSDQVDDCLDLGPAGKYCVRDPIALLWQDVVGGITSNGLCMGMATIVTSFLLGQHKVSDLGGTDGDPHSLPTALEADATTSGPFQRDNQVNGTALGNALISAQAALIDPGFLGAQVTHFGDPKSYSPSAVLSDLRGDLNRDGTALISLREDFAGKMHVVVANALTTSASGDTVIQVLDPNKPYSTQDTVAASPKGLLVGYTAESKNNAAAFDEHAEAVRRSTITLTPSGHWSFQFEEPGGDSAVRAQGPTPAKSEIWAGNLDGFLVIPLSGRPPAHPTLLTRDAEKAGALILAIKAGQQYILGGSATGTRPSVATRRLATTRQKGITPLMTPQGSPAAPALTLLSLAKGRTYTIPLPATRTGPYGVTAFGGSWAVSLQKATAVKGQTDAVMVTPGRATLGYTGHASGPVSFLLAQRGKASRAATLTVGSGKGTTSVAIDPRSGSVTLQRSGPATWVTLEAVAGKADVRTARITLGAGARVTLTPRWAALHGASIGVSTVAGGRTTHRRVGVVAARGFTSALHGARVARRAVVRAE